MGTKREHGSVARPVFFTGVIAGFTVLVVVMALTAVAPLSVPAAVVMLLMAPAFTVMGLLFFWRASRPLSSAAVSAPQDSGPIASDDASAPRIRVVEVPVPAARRPEPIPFEELSHREFS